jgi:sensor histidine kinase regulating citrate/malate metabolism
MPWETNKQLLNNLREGVIIVDEHHNKVLLCNEAADKISSSIIANSSQGPLIVKDETNAIISAEKPF